MSTTIKAGLRDTFDTLARRAYGDPKRAYLLMGANPNVLEPIPFGTILTVPQDPAGPEAAPTRPRANTANTVNLSLGGQKIENFSRVQITRTADSYRTFEVDAAWDPESKNDRDFFKPFQFKRALVSVNNDVYLTGTAVNIVPTVTAGEKSVTISGYSLPGVLNDCMMPISSFPLTFKAQDLEQISRKICQPFGLRVKFLEGAGQGFGEIKFYTGKKFVPKADPDAEVSIDVMDGVKKPKEKKPFDVTSLEPDEAPLDFLFGLARLRGGIWTDDEWGNLCFVREAPTGRPVQKILIGSAPMVEIAPRFEGTRLYSEITAWRPSSTREKGQRYTVKNPHLRGVVRPYTTRADGAEAGAIQHTAKDTSGRMFPELCSWDLTVPSWVNKVGYIWEPGTTVVVNAPDAMIYRDYEFLIREVTLTRERQKESAVLNLVLPGSFSGKMPKALPWD